MTAAHEDAHELRRSVVITIAGYALKLATPALLVFVVALYGKTTWGLFVVAKEALQIGVRICLVGLDKALLWWMPRHREAPLSGFRGSLWLPAAVSTALAGAVSLGAAPMVAALKDAPDAALPLRLMALSLPATVITELLVHATLAMRRPEVNVTVRETLNPTVNVAAAAAFYALGFEHAGLGLGFFVSQWLSLLVAWIWFKRIFRDVPAADGGRLPERAVMRYGLPIAVSEIANSTLQRLDLIAVGITLGQELAGIYGFMLQFSNAVRQIRRSFDPIVVAIVAKISASFDIDRLASGYSYATYLVIATQVPVFAFLFAFGRWLLGLAGPGFDQATPALLLLTAFWGLNGVLGLAGTVVAGLGRAGLTLANTLLTLALQSALLFWFLPEGGMLGAAWAVGLSATAQNLIQLLQIRGMTGRFIYTRKVFPPLVAGAVGALSMGAAWQLAQSAGDTAQRVGSFLVFSAVYGAWALWAYRKGALSARYDAPLA